MVLGECLGGWSTPPQNFSAYIKKAGRSYWYIIGKIESYEYGKQKDGKNKGNS